MGIVAVVEVKPVEKQCEVETGEEDEMRVVNVTSLTVPLISNYLLPST